METFDTLTLPEGPWTTTINVLPSGEEQEQLRRQGYELDGLGRPLHPWLREMLTDPEVGVVTGLGEYWHWGPNKTADPIVINNDNTPKILLIKRSDTGIWALPGGFVDGDESAETAARRELQEETGLLLVGTDGEQVYDGVVADLRTTAHAWAETTAILWRVEGTPTVHAGDDAAGAQWFEVNELPDQLHGSHAVLIEQALDSIDTVAHYNHAISLPHELVNLKYIDGGHMSYHHLHATTPSRKNVFIKSHDATAFTDPLREAHSRGYLHKELKMYLHIADFEPTLIPENVRLENGHTLLMDALDPEGGWHWNAPKETIHSYIVDVLMAAEKLQAIQLPDNFHDTLLPTYNTHIEEGWPTLDNESFESIQTNLEQWNARLRPEFSAITEEFIVSLPSLRNTFKALPAPGELVFSHHDFRQANVAWRPDAGAKIVDWSWAGVGRKNSDATTFLIDLHKSGHDISRYMDHFNQEHALTLIGFWLAHSLWPTRSDDKTVRLHQTISAISAFDLLRN
ncbi:NUDIX domain-containing protein [Candidatus Saccharibacteria bacterium]|nr:NUDIX domain-containing protein [Candidatus Saccharibacteria bacterium]